MCNCLFHCRHVFNYFSYPLLHNPTLKLKSLLAKMPTILLYLILLGIENMHWISVGDFLYKLESSVLLSWCQARLNDIKCMLHVWSLEEDSWRTGFSGCFSKWSHVFSILHGNWSSYKTTQSFIIPKLDASSSLKRYTPNWQSIISPRFYWTEKAVTGQDIFKEMEEGVLTFP